MKEVWLVLFLFLLATSAQAETYKWTDRDGTIHLTDSPGSVPPSSRKSAEVVGSEDKGPSSSAVAPQVEGLKERMMSDSGIMALITALQSDPEMQAVLSDPAIMGAIQSGNIAALTKNPAFMKLLNNPRVQEIQRMLKQGGGR